MISDSLRQRVRASARERCGYCLSRQRYVMGVLEIEHIIPRALGGSDDESNLWLSCSLCNRYKGRQIEAFDPITGIVARLFNPRADLWPEHFQWQAGGVTIQGLTATGRATVVALKLNNDVATTVRLNWIHAGWHPPTI